MRPANIIDIEDTSSHSATPDPRDSEGFAELVKLHHRELLVYAHSLTKDSATAQDIVQDAFIIAYQKINTFDVTRDFGTWMRGIVRNKWREWTRKNKRYILTDKEISELDANVANWQNEKATNDCSIFDALEQCLQRLPDNLKETVLSFYYEGRTGDEAADHLSVSAAAIRKRLQRSRILLKDCVEKKLETLSAPND